MQAELPSSQSDLHFFSLLPWPIPSLMHGEPANGLLVLSRAGLQGEDGTWRLMKAESWMADHPWI